MISRPLGRVTVPRWQTVLAAALAIAGFVAALQFRTERSIRERLNVPSTRLAELASLLQEQERRRAALETEIGDLRARVAESERAAVEGQSSLTRLNSRLHDLRMLAGLVPLEGPGVVVEMRDSPRPIQPGDDPNKTILHYTDIQSVVNELWAAGAEAVAVNDERIMARTGINCVGTTILCNTKRIAPPYRIAAIGDPQRLLAHLRRPGGPVEILAAFEFPVRLQAAARVAVPAYKGIAQFSYTRPVLPGP